jgi:hypothetical protein
MHARFCERIETALAGLQRRIERARKPIDRGLLGVPAERINDDRLYHLSVRSCRRK